MLIGAELAAALPELQAQAESAHTDTFAAFSPAGREPGDDGMERAKFVSEGIVSGKVQAGAREGGDTSTTYAKVGGVQLPVIKGGLHISINDPVPAIGWEYQCTAAGPGHDPGIVGRRYRVVGVPMKSMATARRLDVVEVPGLDLTP